MKPAPIPDLIMDIGMHLGQDTEFYLKKGFRVLAVEANPILARQQEERFAAEIAAKRLEIMSIGIGRERGRLPFYVNESQSEWSSFDREIGSRGGRVHEIPVDTIPLADILARHGIPHYLKIDIEGYDFIAVEALRGFETRPRFVSVENGQKPFLDFFRELGYRRFKFINQQKVPAQTVPFPAREGRYAPHTFASGASGLFGEETPGDWLAYDEVLPQIEAYWNNPQRDANIHGWFDLHAKLGAEEEK